jgi:PAS domain-containing protein
MLARRPVTMAVWRDLTEQRRAELALRDSEERFTSFMDHSPTIAFIKDDQGRYIYVNKPFEEQFGVEYAEDLNGKTDADWLPAETAGSDRRQRSQGLDVRLSFQLDRSCPWCRRPVD